MGVNCQQPDAAPQGLVCDLIEWSACDEHTHLFMQSGGAWGGLTQREQLPRVREGESAEESLGWQSTQREGATQATPVPGAAAWTTNKPTAEASSTAREQVTLWGLSVLVEWLLDSG